MQKKQPCHVQTFGKDRPLHGWRLFARNLEMLERNPKENKVMELRIHGMDCAEEVSSLKRELVPLLDDEERLRFDLLNGKLTVDLTSLKLSQRMCSLRLNALDCGLRSGATNKLLKERLRFGNDISGQF
jgi:hypothetical protein